MVFLMEHPDRKWMIFFVFRAVGLRSRDSRSVASGEQDLTPFLDH